MIDVLDQGAYDLVIAEEVGGRRERESARPAHEPNKVASFGLSFVGFFASCSQALHGAGIYYRMWVWVPHSELGLSLGFGN